LTIIYNILILCSRKYCFITLAFERALGIRSGRDAIPTRAFSTNRKSGRKEKQIARGSNAHAIGHALK
jgi:hypothetical protein